MIVIPTFVRAHLWCGSMRIGSIDYHIPTKTWWEELGFGLDPLPELACSVEPKDRNSLEKIKKRFKGIKELHGLKVSIGPAYYSYCILDDDGFYSFDNVWIGDDGEEKIRKTAVWEEEPVSYLPPDEGFWEKRHSVKLYPNPAVYLMHWEVESPSMRFREHSYRITKGCKCGNLTEADPGGVIQNGRCRFIAHFPNRLTLFDMQFEREFIRDGIIPVFRTNSKAFHLWGRSLTPPSPAAPIRSYVIPDHTGTFETGSYEETEEKVYRILKHAHLGLI